jgi:O-antigen/teichoic acid export membrane protein
MTAKSSFFRQSGWMVIATFVGGLFMLGVQIVALNDQVMPKAESNAFNALLRLTMLFGGVPSAALQAMLARQSAAAVSDEKRRELTATVRALLRTTFSFWLVIAILALVFAGHISSVLKVNNPAALRITILSVLAVILGPTFKGLLQGLHRFASLGWLLILEGVLRLSTFIALVKWMKEGAAGGLWAVFIAQYIILALAIWLSRDVWGAKSRASFSWRKWLILGAPFTLAMGACFFMTISVDFLFVKILFFDDVANVHLYNMAMFAGFAVTQFVGPIAVVMFPTIVRNMALSKKSDALLMTMAVTGGVAALAAVGCTIMANLPLESIVASASHAPLIGPFIGKLQMKNLFAVAPLIPWYVWALLPLTLANVLIQNLLAQGRFAAAPWLMVVPILFVLTLMAESPHLLTLPIFTAFIRVIQTLGFFCLLLFSVAAWFTWRKPAIPV